MLRYSLEQIMKYFEPNTVTHQLAVRVKDLETRLVEAAKQEALHIKAATKLETENKELREEGVRYKKAVAAVLSQMSELEEAGELADPDLVQDLLIEATKKGD